MGNQQSHSKDKATQLWSIWTPNEKEELQKRFDSLNKTPSLPSYFSQDLYISIVTNLKDIVQYLEFIKQVLKSKDTQAIYIVFQKAVEKNQVSLETFVSWVVTSAIPIWFENGSGYSWTGAGSSKSLEKYFICHANEQEKQKKDDMAWLYEDDKENKENKIDSWLEKATESPSKITELEFTNWIKNTPGFIELFQIVVQSIALGKPQDIHKSRINHTSSPQLQKHDKETRRLFDNKFSSLMTPFDYFMLTLHLPINALSWSDYERNQRQVNGDVQHDLIFSSRRDGMSWQNFVNRMVGQGSTLTVIKSKDGYLFGGYADDSWYLNTDWYGNSSNFLFRLFDKYGAWIGTNSNNHYQYLCWGKKSLPNGFGMGGQFDYAGLWIDSDFIHGHSRAGPLCTTYSSPQLSKNDTFIIDEVEVWLVRPLQKDENDDSSNGGGGVLSHAEDMEFMEMAGKKMYSKDLGPNHTQDDSDDET